MPRKCTPVWAGESIGRLRCLCTLPVSNETFFPGRRPRNRKTVLRTFDPHSEVRVSKRVKSQTILDDIISSEIACG
jgi:hypothetical protein